MLALVKDTCSGKGYSVIAFLVQGEKVVGFEKQLVVHVLFEAGKLNLQQLLPVHQL